jgi:sphingosine kinase
VIDVAFRQVIWAGFNRDTRVFDVAYLTRNKKKELLSLIRLEGKVQELDNDAVSDWVESLMNTCYEGMCEYLFLTSPSIPFSPNLGTGIKRNRRLKILVNPHGGVVSSDTSLAVQF